MNQHGFFLFSNLKKPCVHHRDAATLIAAAPLVNFATTTTPDPLPICHQNVGRKEECASRHLPTPPVRPLASRTNHVIFDVTTDYSDQNREKDGCSIC